MNFRITNLEVGTGCAPSSRTRRQSMPVLTPARCPCRSLSVRVRPFGLGPSLGKPSPILFIGGGDSPGLAARRARQEASYSSNIKREKGEIYVY